MSEMTANLPHKSRGITGIRLYSKVVYLQGGGRRGGNKKSTDNRYIGKRTTGLEKTLCNKPQPETQRGLAGERGQRRIKRPFHEKSMRQKRNVLNRRTSPRQAELRRKKGKREEEKGGDRQKGKTDRRKGIDRILCVLTLPRTRRGKCIARKIKTGSILT